MSRIRVLIVDDSAFARKVIREVLARDADIDIVGIARDGLEALEKINELSPDVITLDLIMPELDGLGVLRALKKAASPKVVVVSVSGSETELALEALNEGAVVFVMKPTPFATDRLYELAQDLTKAVHVAAEAKVRNSNAALLAEPVSVVRERLLPVNPHPTQLIVIGTSTGGPQALTDLFRMLPANFPIPIAVALHIPVGYTAPLAARISQISTVPMFEAEDGMEIRAGQALIAPGGKHLKIRKEGSRFFAVVSDEPLETLHHPSVDVLFESAAEACGENVLGLILTGMGNDGMAGSDKIRKAGGRIFAESAESCVVYGMPRCVIEAGIANAEAALEKLPQLIVDNLF